MTSSGERRAESPDAYFGASKEAQLPLWVNRVGLTGHRGLPVKPGERTWSVLVSLSQTGHKETIVVAPVFANVRSADAPQKRRIGAVTTLRISNSEAGDIADVKK